MYVTDTHALIWYTQPKKSRLGKRAKSLFERAEEERALIYVPSVVLWELSDQLRLGTLRLLQRFVHLCCALGSKQGFQIQPLLWEDVNEARGLPFDVPFDCLFACTALCIDVPLIIMELVI